MPLTQHQLRIAIILIAITLISAWPAAVFSQNLAPFAAPGASTLHPTWEASGLPADKGVPRSRLSLAPLAGLERLCQVCNGAVVALVTRPVHVRALRAMLTTTRLMKNLVWRQFEECRVPVTMWSRSAMYHLVCRVYVDIVELIFP